MEPVCSIKACEPALPLLLPLEEMEPDMSRM